MKQVLLRKGNITVEDVPAPARDPHTLLVEVDFSLISTGTELASVQLSGASLIEKAKQRPQEVAKVFDSVKVRGLKKTLALVQDRLDESKPLGYSCSGRVIAVGAHIKNFQVGDRVACAGAAIANHAEVISVPANLAVKIPLPVSSKDASFVTLGSIALQGVRRADVRLGESVCVIGLGLIGQLTVQLLSASGCRVYGVDPDSARVEIAKKNGLALGGASLAEIKTALNQKTNDQGVDATIITASTASSDLANGAFEITRKKGRIVIVGAVGMNLNRSPFYEKEQDFLISCSYGPGRYDADYEQRGHDYPYAYVRWTENRNMAGFLEMLADARLKVSDLVENEYAIAEAEKAYALLDGAGKKPLAIVLGYAGETSNGAPATVISKPALPAPQGKIRLGVIGLGNFAKTVHLPNLQTLSERVEIAGLCAATGASVQTMGRRLKTHFVTTDFMELIRHPDIDAVLIATRHDKHAQMAEEALKAGKHVFLEKPVALERAEVEALDRTISSLSKTPVFMIGFNRRYAPAIAKITPLLKGRNTPLMATYRVNAGALPSKHWVLSEEGGGRMKGEACHMIDLFQVLVGQPLESAQIKAIRSSQATPRPDENFSANFQYQDGSVCQLIYTSLGHPQLPKERIELHWDGKSAVVEDFSTLSLYESSVSEVSSRQDKGHIKALETFFNAIKSGTAFPIPWKDLKETTLATIELDDEIWGRLAP